MAKGIFPVEKMQSVETPFYYYDTEVLRQTLRAINEEANKHKGFVVHYAIKANANPKILRFIREAGLGADCVSGGEIVASIKSGFPSNKIVFAGVGKSDWEINIGLDNDIFCFNVESIPELEVINSLAAAKGKIARSLQTQSECWSAHPREHHDRSGREQVRYCHARHGNGNRRSRETE